jgi:hypothetical protein
MATAQDLVDSLRTFDITANAAECLIEHAADVEELQRAQLYDGKTSTGDDLSPTYFTDPYFKSPKQAAAYSRWKDKITPNPRRKKGVPNLFIVGTFHSTIQFIPNAIGGWRFTSSFYAIPSMLRKYGTNMFGLDDEYKGQLNIERGMLKTWRTLVTAGTGLEFT